MSPSSVELRTLLFEDSALSDLLLWTFMARQEGLQAREGVGAEIVGPHSSEATRQLVEFARRNRLPFTWLDTARPEHAGGLTQISGLADDEIPLVRLPGGHELRNPSAGEVSRALGIGLDLYLKMPAVSISAEETPAASENHRGGASP